MKINYLYRAYSIMKSTVLAQQLGKQGYEFVEIAGNNPDGTRQIVANKLHIVNLFGKEKIYTLVPVTLTVKMGSDKAVKIIDGGTLTSDEEQEADYYIKTLVDNKQLQGVPGMAADHPTHEVKLNNNGQKVIRRVSVRR